MNWLDALEALDRHALTWDHVRSLTEPLRGIAHAHFVSRGLESEGRAFLERVAEQTGKSALLSEVCRQAVASDPEWFLKNGRPLFAGIKTDRNLQALVREAIERVSGGDAQVARQLVAEFGWEEAVPDVGAYVDPRTAVREARAIEDRKERSRALASAYTQWARRNASSAWEHAKTTLWGSEWVGAAQSMFWEGRRDQPEVFFEMRDELMRHLPETDDEILVRIATSWARRDFKAAIVAADRLELGGPRETYLAAIVKGGSVEHPRFLLERLPPRSLMRSHAFDDLVVLMARDNLQACETWIRTLGDPGELQSAADVVFDEKLTRMKTEARLERVLERGVEEGWARHQSRLLRVLQQRVREGASIEMRDSLFNLPPEVAASAALAVGEDLLVKKRFDEAAAFVRALHPSAAAWMWRVKSSRERHAFEQSPPYQNAQRWLDRNEGNVAVILEDVEDGRLRDLLARQWLLRDPNSALAHLANAERPPRESFLNRARSRLAIYERVKAACASRHQIAK